ncbi:MAG TPA: hypothetical protein VF589_03650 [Allosphingosinicella sp.]|jgi:hypothetical protein
MPASLNIPAARNVPFANPIYLYYSGAALPLTGASIKMQIRLYPGAPGAALATVAAIPHTDAAAPTGADAERRLLTLFPTIAEATLAALTSGLEEPEPGDADRYSYDIVVTYADAAEDTLAEGYFLLKPGVTL